MNASVDDDENQASIFFPNASRARARVKSVGGRFVYYTNAETAVRILQNREIWMRNALTMNDFMEVEHGLNSLLAAYDSPAGEAFEAALNRCYSSIAEEIRDLFNMWVPAIRRDTFITCLSEHEVDEDTHGRLSMWRAYGGNAGVALVLNGGPMLRDSEALPAYTSPVAYCDEEGLKREIAKVAENIDRNVDFIRAMSRDSLKGTVFHLLRFAVTCTKHPAFREEREWRIISSPTMEESPLMPTCVEVINGVPQTVLKIKLEDHPEKGLYGVTPNDLLERVLIGPCAHPEVVFRALHQVLLECGIQNPNERIIETRVPLRIGMQR